MFRDILILLFLLFIYGCATSDWNNFTGQSQNYGAICELCGRKMEITPYVASNYSTVICPFCQHEQAMQPALARWTYGVQQAQQQQAYVQQTQWSSAAADIVKIQEEGNQRRSDILMNNSINRRSTNTNCYTYFNNTRCSSD